MMQRKVCLVGDFAVGKTSLFNRLVFDRFEPGYLSTLGVRIQRTMIDSSELALLVWDTEGGRADTLIKSGHVAGAACTMIVCDLTRPGTIDRCSAYAAELRRLNPDTPLLLVANKLDLVAADHPHVDRARSVAAALDLPLMLTSACDGTGVAELFEAVADHVTAQLIA